MILQTFWWDAGNKRLGTIALEVQTMDSSLDENFNEIYEGKKKKWQLLSSFDSKRQTCKVFNATKLYVTDYKIMSISPPPPN